MWLLKPLTHNTCFVARLIITKNDSTQNHLEPVEMRSRFMKPIGYLDFEDFFVEVGVTQIRPFSKQVECGMIYQLSLTRYFFPINFHSNPNTKTAMLWYKHIRGPLYHHGLTLIPSWVSNYTPNKVWDEITFQFPNFDGRTVEVWEWINNFIRYIIMNVITYLCWD